MSPFSCWWLALFLRTRTGVAMRATAFDQEAAGPGLNVGRMFSVAWAIGAVLAAVAGLFASVFPRRATGVDQATAFIAFRAFPAVIIGGLDSVVGAVVGGFVVGIAESAANTYLGFEFLGNGFPGSSATCYDGRVPRPPLRPVRDTGDPTGMSCALIRRRTCYVLLSTWYERIGDAL